MRVLALDIGDKRIGVALSDSMAWLASPLTVIKRGNRPAELDAILALVRQHQVERIVIGYPRSLSGETGAQAKKVEQYAQALCKRMENVDNPERRVLVSFWDERLSTAQAERMVHESGRRVQRESIDALAAAVILQGYLDARQLGSTDEEGSICEPKDAI